MIRMMIIPLLIAAYLIWRAVLPLHAHKGVKILLAILLVLSACKFQLIWLFGLGGPMYLTPDLPGPVLFLSEIPYAVTTFLFIVTLALEIPRDVFLLVCRLKKAENAKKRFRKTERHLHAVILFCAVILTVWGMLNGMALPELRKVDIPVKNLPDSADGLKILLLADLHADRMTREGKMQKIVQMVNEREPDIVVIAGDFADGMPDRIGYVLAPLSQLKARYGVFGVPGNHDYFSDYDEWADFLPGLGIRMLTNHHVVLPCGVVLAGVADPAASRFGKEAPDLTKALNQAPKDSPVILLAHQPKHAAEAAKCGVDLQLSGHTHGGMTPLLKQVVKAANKGFVSGLYPVGDMQLYVSNGTCIWSGFSIRLFTPAELTEIRLIKK